MADGTVAAARVIPAVPSFSVDKGFWYSIPGSHRQRVSIGSIVRIPLGGRRVRGYVVEMGKRPPARLKPIGGVSGDLPIFDERLREALVWLANHYVAPVSVALERAAPPNLPSAVAARAYDPATVDHDHPLEALVNDLADGKKRPVTCLLTSWEDMSWLGPVATAVGRGKSFMIVAATAPETAMVAEAARPLLGRRVIEASGDHEASRLTKAWSTVAGNPGHLLVGTPRVASWPVADLIGVAVLEEGRRAMKDRQTPTVSARRLLMTRARLEGFGQIYVGPTPSLDLLAAGPTLTGVDRRTWPLVEVVDRTEDPPGSGLITQRARRALDGVADRNWRTFVFTHRRGFAPAFRCAQCRQLRRCPKCGSRPEPGETCVRCGEPSHPCLNCGSARFEPLGAGVGRVLNELAGRYGDLVGTAEESRPITVGTERDLAAIEGVDLGLVVDADGLALGSNYRAGEEALRILARVAGRVGRGGGRRLILQTGMVDHPLIVALRRGDPLGYLRHELAEREAAGYPPATEIMVVEVTGDAEQVDADLRLQSGDGALILGPAPSGDARRWLIQAPALGAFKAAIRTPVQKWRDSGSTVRIDVDPLDL